jgi:hypothetical protein
MVEQMVGLFMDHPYAPVQFRRLATHENYLIFKGILDKNPPGDPDHEGWKNVVELILKSWKEGKWLTPPQSYWGFDLYPVNPVHYTHPVVMLIDELAGSGGDAFPALMQGYGRATLLGRRTVGAGGHVVADPPLYWSQITLNLTRSLFYRPDGVEVENNGVEPDVPYATTVADLRTGYLNYRDFYTRELLKRVR